METSRSISIKQNLGLLLTPTSVLTPVSALTLTSVLTSAFDPARAPEFHLLRYWYQLDKRKEQNSGRRKPMIRTKSRNWSLSLWGCLLYLSVGSYRGKKVIAYIGKKNRNWTVSRFCPYYLFGILAGLIGGLLGLGGRTILCPLFLELGVPPQLFTFSRSLVYGLVGQHAEGKLIKKLGRAPLIVVFVLASTIFVSAVLLGKLPSLRHGQKNRSIAVNTWDKKKKDTSIDFSFTRQRIWSSRQYKWRLCALAN